MAGQWNEGPQVGAITADTDLVTITIGGNDMPFEDFAVACTSVGTGSVNCSGQPYADALQGIQDNVIPGVTAALQAIEAKLQAVGSGARVLVMGYPYLLPEAWSDVVVYGECQWLFQDEHAAIRSVQTELNVAVKGVVIRSVHLSSSLLELPIRPLRLSGTRSVSMTIPTT